MVVIKEHFFQGRVNMCIDSSSTHEYSTVTHHSVQLLCVVLCISNLGKNNYNFV
jgi:hypothetical protein